MKRLVVNEHTRISRRKASTHADDGDDFSLDERLYERLRRFDRLERQERDRVFDWSDGYFRTTQWVGVIQIPGLQLEILPKADRLTDTPYPEAEQARYEIRRNLLYMLAVSGNVPVRSRDVARLAIRRAPLSETLAVIFADRLRQELLCGPERAYRGRMENLRCFKGKLLVPRHAQLNSAHRERFYCRFDEFSDDTLMNRVFRAACRALLALSHTPGTQDVLRQCLLLLDGVTDVGIQDADFSRISINRQNERFEDILQFCRLILKGKSPTIQVGGNKTFSLLFDMNKVFERFVAAFLRRFVMPKLDGISLFPQATRHKRHMLSCADCGVLRLDPDLLIEGPETRIVMDTKWKLLAPGKKGRGGVSGSDLYQLHAYTTRYGCLRSILLYPHTVGLVSRDFDILNAEGNPSGAQITVRHVGLHRNLHQEAERIALATELEAIVREGLRWKKHNPLH